MQKLLDIKQFFAKKSTIGSIIGAAVLLTAYKIFQVKKSNRESGLRDDGLQIIKEPPGLKNLGNTCYLNAVLQALASLPHFYKFIVKLAKLEKNESSLDSSIIRQLEQIIICLNQNDQDILFIGEFLDLMNRKSDFTFCQEQQDSHELLKMIMGVVDAQLKVNAIDLTNSLNPMNDNKISNPMNGYISQILQCTKCEHRYHMKVDCFNDITLSIEKPKIINLNSAFNNFFELEYVEDVECLECSIKKLISNKKDFISSIQSTFLSEDVKKQCTEHLNKQISFLTSMGHRSLLESEEIVSDMKEMIESQLKEYKNPTEVSRYLSQSQAKIKNTMKKFVRFVRLPKILCIHLNRVTYDQRGYQTKIGKPIAFDETLQIKDWVDKRLFNEDASSPYQLTAVVRHYGSESFGHYITYRKAWHQDLYRLKNSRNKFFQSVWSFTSDDSIIA